jgi:HPt (histidine-containing phosphotransfer) domain-containing protein
MEDYLVKPVTLDALRAALGKSRPVERTDGGPRAETPGVLDETVLSQLREDLGGRDQVAQVVALFLQNTPRTLADLRGALSRGDLDAVRRGAHTIKGTSATLGARVLSERSVRLERQAREGQMHAAAASLSEIEDAWRGAEAALREEIDRLPVPTSPDPPER